MTSAGRWSLAALVVVAALVVAIWPRGGDDTTPTSTGPSSSAYQPPTFTPSSESLDQLRSQAALASCPTPTGEAPAGSALAGITLDCVSDGAPVDLAAAVGGKRLCSICGRTGARHAPKSFRTFRNSRSAPTAASTC